MSGRLANRYCVVGLVSVVAVVVGLVFVAPVAAAGVDILNTNGFESPTYSVAVLANQNGWKQDGIGTATVQTTVKASGDQAVEVIRTANEDSRWFVPTSGHPSSNRYIDISWDMYVESSNLGGDAYGPFFGVEAYQDTYHTDGVLGVLGALGVDANTGDVLYEARNKVAGGDPVLLDTGTVATLDAWNNFRIRLDFADSTCTTYFNGGELGTAVFADAGLSTFTDADISALAAMDGPISQGATGRAYFDNFKVQEVPEPSAIVLCLTALAAITGFAWRRR